MKSEQFYSELKEAIISGDIEKAKEITQRIIKEGFNTFIIIKEVIPEASKIVGKKFEDGEYALPHLLFAGTAMEEVGKLVETTLPLSESKRVTIVIATVEGDLHSIGKNIVAMMLRASGFKVIDLGVDVKSSTIISKALEHNADIIALSALMTTTMPYQREVIEDLKSMNLRNRFKVIVGGGPVTNDWADKIGADGYAKDAIEAVGVVKRLIQ